jgi:hypothetical protein
MNRKDKDTDQDLFRKWQRESSEHTQRLNFTEMEKLLKKASSDFSDSVKKTLKLDMIFKLCMITGFLIVMIMFIQNSFVLITSLLFLLAGTLALMAENNFLKGIRKTRALERNVSDLIREELKFYRSNLLKYPVVISLSIAMFYVLGSMIYHAIHYGFIRPFRDITDVLVLGGLMLLGVVISFAANFPFFLGKIKNLESLASDLENEDRFTIREKEIRVKKQLTLGIFVFLAIMGILLLIYVIAQ